MDTNKLLAAIKIVESGGDPNAIGDDGKAIGILQIHEEVIIDVNSIYRLHYSWPEDAYNPNVSEDIFLMYVRHWGRVALGRLPNMQEAARIWNGGPRGNEKLSTLAYWQKVYNILDNEKTVQE